MNPSPNPITTPLRSEFTGEPGMDELIRAYVGEMPERIASLRRAWEDEDGHEIRRLAHQMKGSAAGYGFAPLGQAARALEAAMIAAEQDIEAVRSEFDALVALCARASN